MKLKKSIIVGAIISLFIPETTFAAALWWDSAFTTIADSLTGPVATSIAVIACVAVGAMISSGEGGGSAKRGIQFIIGMCLMLLATKAVTFFKNL